MKGHRLIACVIFCVLSLFMLSAETTSMEAVPYGSSEFPEWQKDLRRAEILSFGSLPFVTFMASIYFDIYRYVDHNGAEGYLPWPFKKSSVAVPLTEQEQMQILLASAGISVGVAVFDFGFRAIKRYIRISKAEKRNREIVEPIQIEPISGGE